MEERGCGKCELRYCRCADCGDPYFAQELTEVEVDGAYLVVCRGCLKSRRNEFRDVEVLEEEV